MSLPQMSDSSTSSETIVSFAMSKCSDGAPGPRLRLTQRSDEVQHLGGMAAGIDAVEHVPHGALLVDDESGARDAGFPGSVRFLLVHHAVFPADLALGVREQPDRNAVLVPETGVAKTIVRAHPEHHAAVAGKLVFVVGEIGGLQRAIGSAVLGIEIEHDVFLAPELAEVHRFHVRVGKREKRCRLTRLQHIRRAFGRPERRLVCAFQVFLASFKASTDYNRGDENATAGWAERRKIFVTILAKETAAGPQRDYRL